MFEHLQKLKDNGFNPSKILDIGAWNGIWTRSTKEIWPDAHYTCIEAGKKHEGRLKKCADESFIAVLGNENKEVNIYLREIEKHDKKKITYTKGSNIFGKILNFPSDAQDPRQMQTLDELVGKDAQYDLIKQDVQGAELLVMQGSPEIFKRAKYVIQEVNLYKDEDFLEIPDEKEMDSYMKTLGFTNSIVIDKHNIETVLGSINQVDKLYWKD